MSLAAPHGLRLQSRERTERKAISGRPAGVNRQVVDEFMATGAVVAGRGDR
jgi:hypothetical protein